ncbi:energy transducer TonB [Thermomonas sp. HDW16]|uniref:energy transducer TonB n=1 Tax=Thermomonas sp. HDW16 TaxID=2714945 RepID=UPI001F110E95|nr:energy transducer TonB [Thermomonas sp. HDW16]
MKPLAIAFGVGLLLFLLLWLDQRNDSDFFKAGGPTTSTGEIETLPAPVPADVASEDGTASGLTMPREDTRPGVPETADQPRIIEPPAPPAPAPAPAAPASVTSTDAVPVSRPPPRYPQSAMRRNIGGTVRVQATVAPDGSVERLELAAGSGNRDLDRAAMEAVRRWTFRPATRNGQPVASTVVVPLEFNPGR